MSNWLWEATEGRHLFSPKGLFFLIETGLILGIPIPEMRRWARRLPNWANADGGFGVWQNLGVEVSSELDTTYRAVAIMLDLGMDFDDLGVRKFVHRFLNEDGGFGGGGFSTLPSTFCAVQILNRLGVSAQELSPTVDWLSRRDAAIDMFYIEDVYWLVSALSALGVTPGRRNEAVDFVLTCRRESGGFARARFGIPTLEYTYYALEIIAALGVT